MNKTVLRKVFLEKRLFLSAEEYTRRNEHIERVVFNTIDFSTLNTIHIFLPIGKFKEVNTWNIIERLRKEYKNLKICIPRTNPETHTLEHIIFEKKSQIGVNSWGIPEPLWGDQISETEIDLIFVPLISFDKQGNRIGYGKGFYDRFLTKCMPDTQKIGLSLSPPLDLISYADAHDIPLDSCINPFGKYYFKGETVDYVLISK